ncbi:putative mitochondrial carnitine:acyl carnitine carrier [Ascobolus immersus RN42]|uniref:Putative mitochondrial carnitine:acyl carnitine carrier n=1 Tax=Ascobolus immersus RN42 TaxID=1160509 RepID=A0A3N4I6Q3_ASCIM|nr:putative mitochondrial carnitine:acyl carnitine carrier [Ascobolus immersus RN42]
MSSKTETPVATPAPLPTEEKKFAQLRSLVAGGVGGVAAVITGHPFDLVKVRLQTAEKGLYTGAIDVVKKSVARDGLTRGLYAGVTAPLLGVTPMFAVSFWGYDVGKKLVRSFSPGTSATTPLSIAQVSAAGFFSAIPMTIITAPMERVKVVMQTSTHASTTACVKHLYKTGGVQSLFRGSVATLARDGPGSAAYFATYEILKKQLTPAGSTDLSLGAVMTAGGMAGVSMWVLVFPVDTVKSRLQSSVGNVGIGEVVRTIYRTGGFKAFFPGIAPALARSFPANAATFLGVELAHKAMDKIF